MPCSAARSGNSCPRQGGVAKLAQQCETVSAWHRGNDLPLLWPIHAKHRVLLFWLLDLMDVRSATQDHSLLDAPADRRASNCRPPPR